MVLDVERLAPGMILLEDVLFPNGAVLLGAGKALDEALIALLRAKKIDLVQVVPDAASREAAGAMALPDETQEGAQEGVLDLADQAAALLAADNGGAADEGGANPDRESGSDEGEAPPQVSPLPDIAVTIAPDRLSAKVTISPREGGENLLAADELVTALNEAGLVHGIDDKAIRGVINQWGKHKRVYDIEPVAHGTEPVPGTEGEFEMKVTHLDTEGVIEEARRCTYYWQLADLGVHVDRVDPGTVIARRGRATPPEPGIGVDGREIPCSEIRHGEVPCDGSVETSGDTNEIVARHTGVACRSPRGTISQIPLDFNGSFELVIPATWLRAEVIVHPSGPGGGLPPLDLLRSMLTEQGVVFGIDEERLARLETELAQGSAPAEPVCIARAKTPTNGDNGRVELKFNPSKSLKPHENEDGSLDYKNIDIIVSVSKGDVLAVLVPPTKGEAGTDIRGTVLPAGDGVAALLPAGPNTEVSPADPTLLLAAQEGNVSCSGNLVQVHEGYVIKGNVDYSTGNVRYKQSVAVGGDIVSGFSITCGGDLQVKGTIEDAQVSVGGCVLCGAGFVGTGKGVIESRGDTHVVFVKNQTIRSRSSIIVARECINAMLYARKAIHLQGNPLSAAGGVLVARDLVEVHTVGNLSNIKTVIEVGEDYVLREELVKTEEQHRETGENLRKILETAKKYERIAAVKKGNLPPAEKELFTKIQATIVKYREQISALESRMGIINAKRYNTAQACVKISHAAYPGTHIRIGERHFLVKEEIVGPKTVRLVNYEIKVL